MSHAVAVYLDIFLNCRAVLITIILISRVPASPAQMVVKIVYARTKLLNALMDVLIFTTRHLLSHAQNARKSVLTGSVIVLQGRVTLAVLISII